MTGSHTENPTARARNERLAPVASVIAAVHCGGPLQTLGNDRTRAGLLRVAGTAREINAEQDLGSTPCGQPAVTADTFPDIPGVHVCVCINCGRLLDKGSPADDICAACWVTMPGRAGSP